MASLIDEHRAKYGVEQICAELPIAPATYYEHKVRQRDPLREPVRVQRDRMLSEEVRRVRKENFEGYGARKVWLQLNREKIPVARCTVERLWGFGESFGGEPAARRYRTVRLCVLGIWCSGSLLLRARISFG